MARYTTPIFTTGERMHDGVLNVYVDTDGYHIPGYVFLNEALCPMPLQRRPEYTEGAYRIRVKMKPCCRGLTA